METIMLKPLAAGIALAWMLLIAAPLVATETWSGTLVCAKCGLKKADATECQDVLLVEEKGATVEYYIAKNETTKGEEACTIKIPATVTGTAFERDGKKWIEPTKIEKR
jgi:hypothetical protein